MAKIPGGGSKVAPIEDDVLTDGGGKGAVTDPTLAVFANFTIQVESRFNGGSGEGTNGYNRKSHRFLKDYIKPSSYEVRLDALSGLLAGAQIATRKPVPQPQRKLRLVAKEIAKFAESLKDNGGPGFEDPPPPGPGGPPLLPDNLIAYQWVIEEDGGSFVDSKLVQRPITPMHLAVFRVPRAGIYKVRLRVVFKDGRRGERKVRFQFKEFFIASIGDSYSSGEGNANVSAVILDPPLVGVCEATTLSKVFGSKPKVTQRASWTEAKAHRSMKSGPALGALILQRVIGDTFVSPLRSKHDFFFRKIVFGSLARSGARIGQGLMRAQKDLDDFIGVGQLEELKRTAGDRPIDALLISIGANDIGFAGSIEELVGGDTMVGSGILKPIDGGNDQDARDTINRRLDQLLGINLPKGQKGGMEKSYDALGFFINELRASPGLGRVYILSYPTGLFETRKPGGKIGFRSCGLFDSPDLDISKDDFDLIQLRGQQLNQLIARKAAEFGWHLVDVDEDFRGRGYCMGGKDRFWVQAEESCRRQGDFDGTLHPNHLGHSVIAQRIAEALLHHTVTS